MPAGIIARHQRSSPSTSELVRGDVLALIGVIPRERWPQGAERGDFVQHSFGAENGPPPREAPVDAVTTAAAEAFLVNGGHEGHILAVCIDRADRLAEPGACQTGVLQPALEHLEGLDVGLLAMPGLAWLAGDQSLAPWRGLMEHCQRVGHRFVILDPPHDVVGSGVLGWAAALAEQAGAASSFGALYHPWLQRGSTSVPPSGAVAGMAARIERAHAPYGFHRAPANASLQGVVQPVVELRGPELEALLNGHVNPIVTMPGRGVVVWGARTLAREAPFGVVSTRRIVSAVAEQLRRDSEWAVFEDNQPALWSTLARHLGARLDLLHTAGVLTTGPTGEAYRVVCDAELNPPALRDAGELHVRVELQPVSTTEQIVVDLRLEA